MFISTPKQLSEAIQELTPYQWADEELCKKLTLKEFGYLTVLIHKYGAENKIIEILQRADNRD